MKILLITLWSWWYWWIGDIEVTCCKRLTCNSTDIWQIYRLHFFFFLKRKNFHSVVLRRITFSFFILSPVHGNVLHIFNRIYIHVCMNVRGPVIIIEIIVQAKLWDFESSSASPLPSLNHKNVNWLRWTLKRSLFRFYAFQAFSYWLAVVIKQSRKALTMQICCSGNAFTA